MMVASIPMCGQVTVNLEPGIDFLIFSLTKTCRTSVYRICARPSSLVTNSRENLPSPGARKLPSLERKQPDCIQRLIKCPSTGLAGVSATFSSRPAVVTRPWWSLYSVLVSWMLIVGISSSNFMERRTCLRMICPEPLML
ncbi:hypothetical protein BDW62DRAFT_195496 [Aspergillus aurantiobrunneus]